MGVVDQGKGWIKERGGSRKGLGEKIMFSRVPLHSPDDPGRYAS